MAQLVCTCVHGRASFNPEGLRAALLKRPCHFNLLHVLATSICYQHAALTLVRCWSLALCTACLTLLQAFVLLGLRHLIVVDAQNRIVGIITRKDLDHAAGHGWWRMSAQAPKPKRASKRRDPFNR